MDIICCYPRGYGGLRSQVVVSSLPPCSLSLLRRGAETGAVPARSPVPSLPGKMGLLVPNAAQAAPLQFSSCRWCSCLFSCNEPWVQESQKLVQTLSLPSKTRQNWLIFKLAHIILLHTFHKTHFVEGPADETVSEVLGLRLLFLQ